MAGNIPAVGFHDILCILVSGNILAAKLSDKDTYLIQFFLDQLIEIEPNLIERISIVDKLVDIDAVIATGSDNTARYFEYYFKKYPNIIRKNRTSIAILDGEETDQDLINLGKDIFLYFGLGCRNVSKLYVPKGYDFKKLLYTYESYDQIINHHKYRNNYDHNKSIGIVLLKQDTSLVSPIAVLYYDHYSSENELKESLAQDSEKIQCIVSRHGQWTGSLPFGEAQSPGLMDYADGIDTMAFLSEL